MTHIHYEARHGCQEVLFPGCSATFDHVLCQTNPLLRFVCVGVFDSRASFQLRALFRM